MTLKEYYDSNANQSRPEPDSTRSAELAQQLAEQERQRAEAAQRAPALKDSIAQQLQAGNEPQLILYTAIKCIGYLTQDDQWANDCKAQLDNIYSGLEQSSLLVDTAAAAQKRLDTQAAEFNQKARRAIERQMTNYQKLNDSLQEALDALDAAEYGLDTLPANDG